MYWDLSSCHWCRVVDMSLYQCWQDKFFDAHCTWWIKSFGVLFSLELPQQCAPGIPPLILQLCLYSLVEKPVPDALSSRKFCNMSNGVGGDNVRRATSKSHLCFRPLILWLTYVGRLTDDTECGPSSFCVPGSSIAPGVISGSVLVWLFQLHTQSITVRHHGTTAACGGQNSNRKTKSVSPPVTIGVFYCIFSCLPLA